jgi:hypothetical protein
MDRRHHNYQFRKTLKKIVGKTVNATAKVTDFEKDKFLFLDVKIIQSGTIDHLWLHVLDKDIKTKIFYLLNCNVQPTVELSGVVYQYFSEDKNSGFAIKIKTINILT